jgi:hypothetical protein
MTDAGHAITGAYSAGRRVDALHLDAPARPGRTRILYPSHHKQDDEHDQNDADYADTAMAVAVAVSAEAAAESPEQEDDKQDDQNKSN